MDTYARYKNDLLNWKIYFFFYNMLQEFDWKYTLEFISNRNKFFAHQTSIEDSMERSFKVKIFFKILPTYGMLYKIKANFVDDNLCIN